MGMAASQARYLGLTARKTNTEYEGQQVNQQRTALANQSANLFNQLMAMAVPVPPSVEDYNKTIYSYNDGANVETITKTQPIDDPDFNYMVTHNHLTKEYTGIQNVDSNPQVRQINIQTKNNQVLDPAGNPVVFNPVTGTYTVDGNLTVPYNSNNYEQRTLYEKIRAADPDFANNTANKDLLYDETKKAFYSKDELALSVDGTTAFNSYGEPTGPIRKYFLGNSEAFSVDMNDKIQKHDLETIIKDMKAKTPTGTPYPAFVNAYDAGKFDELYTYTKGGKTFYACQADLNASLASKPNSTENQAKMYTYNASELDKMVELTEKALIEKDAQGRMQSIKFENSTAVYLLHTEIDKNDIGYDDAMNKYSYDIMLYNQKVEDVNSQTKIIQEQDRTLELRLKQLDTEQKALQTEMEAVAKVIQKNVETTFKTFSS